MKKINIIIVCCCMMVLASAKSFAQSNEMDSTLRPSRLKMLTVSPGFAILDASGLNRFLAPGTNGSFGRNYGVLGFQKTSEYKRFIYGATFQGGMSQQTTVVNYAGVAGLNVDYNGAFGNFLLHGGYSIISTKRVKFYPMIGAGFGGVSANFTNIDNQSIANFANNPAMSGRVTKSMVCFDASLSLDLLFPSSRNWEGKSSTTNFGRVVGIRVGYTQNLGMGDWRLDGARIIENPSYNPGMAYAKLQFGIYSNRSRRGCHGHGDCRK
ncbi:MAG TPA: hypothetical protein VK766_09180 [Cytophagaceae bacterium]|jgi:opacity protein-like surface antigen|nr:hypothetical protein [Cytophagaceae bacterium]